MTQETVTSGLVVRFGQGRKRCRRRPAEPRPGGADRPPSLGRLYSAGVAVRLNGERRKAMADHVTTASKRQLLRPLGAPSGDDMAAVAKVVDTQLSRRPGLGRPARSL